MIKKTKFHLAAGIILFFFSVFFLGCISPNYHTAKDPKEIRAIAFQ